MTAVLFLILSLIFTFISITLMYNYNTVSKYEDSRAILVFKMSMVFMMIILVFLFRKLSIVYSLGL